MAYRFKPSIGILPNFILFEQLLRVIIIIIIIFLLFVP